MDRMFVNAASLKHQLCGAAWVHSTASKDDMFAGSSGSIPRTVCASAPTPGTNQAPPEYVSRRPISERELIVRTPIATSAITPAITATIMNTITCPKCGMFAKSGRVSCCAPGGAWFKNCGHDRNKNVDHRWFEGAVACKRKFKTDCIYIDTFDVCSEVLFLS